MYLGSGKVERSSLVSGLVNNSYYSLVKIAVPDSEVLFASVLETHGYFNEGFEPSVNARGFVNCKKADFYSNNTV